jgi:alkylation response protein AidB-like acyl-CoA dehydrogenase
MIGFAPTEDQRMMMGSAAQLARTTLRPKMREFERARGLPEEVRKTAHELGLGMVALPEALGGAGLGLGTAVLLEEEIAWGDPAAAFGLAGPGAFGMAVAELAGDKQAQALLAPFAEPAGYARFGAVAWGEASTLADRAGFATTATKSGAGYRLDGEKSYVINADCADVFLVFAEVDASKGWRGLGAFVVKKGAPGLTVMPRKATLGLDAASFGGIALKGVEVGESDRISTTDFDAGVVRFFAKSALLVAARAVGLSRAAFEITREYCDTRRAFGKPIGHFQAVAFTLADRAMDLDAARSMVWRAAWAWDTITQRQGPQVPPAGPQAGGPTSQGEREALLRTAHAVSFALEAAMRSADDAVQLHGGSGFMRDYPVEKLMRDAKQLQLCAMTAEQCDELAAAIELGLSIDPALVLPTPESQNTFI